MRLAEEKIIWLLVKANNHNALYKYMYKGPLWSWSYGSWIYKYPCNQCLLPLTLWVQIPLWWGVLDTTLCDKVYQWLAAGRWFSLETPVSSTNKTDLHNITEILLKVALKTIMYHVVFKKLREAITFESTNIGFLVKNKRLQKGIHLNIMLMSISKGAILIMIVW